MNAGKLIRNIHKKPDNGLTNAKDILRLFPDLFTSSNNFWMWMIEKGDMD
jgi:hypothetical protein